MFNFTTTTFIHSNDLFEANPNGTTGTFRVNGVNLFKKEDIVGIYRNPYTDPVNGKLELAPGKVYAGYSTVQLADNLPAISNRTHFRLNFYLKRSGDNNSYYSNDMVFKGKDFHYEWVGSKTAAQLAKIFTKINKLYGDIYLKIYASGNNLVFENDNYGLFTQANVEFWEDANSDCCTYREGQWRVLDELDLTALEQFEEGDDNCSYLDPNSDTITALTSPQMNPYITSADSGLEAHSSLTIHKCVNGTGTYQQVMKDLRLPTAENDGPWSITAQQQEIPIPGNKYVQYTLHYISCRGVLGGSAVGEVTHSKTTHVFFVPADCCACASGKDAEFLAALKAAGLEQLLVDVQAGVVGDGTKKPEKVNPTINPLKATQPVADTESFALTNKPTSDPVPDNDPGLHNNGKASSPAIETPKNGKIREDSTSEDKDIKMVLKYNMPIYYTTDGTEPTTESTPYEEELSGTQIIEESGKKEVTIKAAAGRTTEELSPSVTKKISKEVTENP